MQLTKLVSSGVALLLAGALGACGGQGGLAEEYGQTETGQWFTILEFKGSDQVTLTMIGSSDRHNGTYTREGDTVTIKAAGEARTLKIDAQGCLEGGPGNSFFSGKICKKS